MGHGSRRFRSNKDFRLLPPCQGAYQCRAIAARSFTVSEGVARYAVRTYSCIRGGRVRRVDGVTMVVYWESSRRG
ncbi:hypothetical protein M8818_005886 [Zalaria obscura]|uniref:Uncharacterized protein n=1 Tax=Zalaria obscura TaxID=2024903 RepID=A0ACC3S7K5_9PEZI